MANLSNATVTVTPGSQATVTGNNTLNLGTGGNITVSGTAQVDTSTTGAVDVQAPVGTATSLTTLNNTLVDIVGANRLTYDPVSGEYLIDYNSGGSTSVSASLNASGQGTATATGANGQSTSTTVANWAGLYTTVGSAFGSSLGRIIAGSNPLAQIAVSTTLGTTLGDIVTLLETPSADLAKSFNTVIGDFPVSVEEAGAGAVAGYLTGELVNALGINGFPAAVLNTFAGHVVSTIATNLATPGADAITGTVGNAATDLSSVADWELVGAQFVGTEIAQAIYQPSTPQGSEGAAVASAVGNAVDAYVILSDASLSGDPVVIAAAAVAAILYDILGGVIGDLFGQTSTSHIAEANFATSVSTTGLLSFNSSTSLYQGGPVDDANAAGEAVTSALNDFLAAVGGTVVNASSLTSFGVGFNTDAAAGYDSEFRYSSAGMAYYYFDNTAGTNPQFWASDSSTIFPTIVDYAVMRELSEMVFSGGDPYMERAIDAALRSPYVSGTQSEYLVIGSNLDYVPSTATLSGYIQVAQDYETYEANRATINALILGNPTSSYALNWISELTLAGSLGFGTSVQGGTDNDTLGVLPGYNILIGGGGDDTYVVNQGDGNVTIDNGVSYDNAANGILEFNTPGLYYTYNTTNALAPGKTNLTFTGNGVDLIIGDGQGDNVTLKGWFAGSFAEVNQISLANGTIIGLFYIQLEVGQESTTNLGGFNIPHTTHDIGIEDTNGLTNSNNTTAGGDGQDILAGGSGANNFITGGGTDIVYGGGGYDTYGLQIGGQLTIYNNAKNDGSLGSNTSASGELDIGGGVTGNQLIFLRNGNDLLVDIYGSSSQVTIKNWFSNASSQLQSINTADGVSFTYNSATGQISGTTRPDSKGKYQQFVWNTSSTVQWSEYTAYYNAAGQSYKTTKYDYYFDKGDGQESITLSGTSDVVQLATDIPYTDVNFSINLSGNAVLTLSDTGDSITFNGTGPLPPVEVLYNGNPIYLQVGSSATDVLTGIAGPTLFDSRGAPAGLHDYETGAGSGDIFLFNSGYGKLEINEYQTSTPNELRLGNGITPANVTVSGDGQGDVILTIGSNGDRIQLDNMLTSSSYGVQAVTFSDGTIWSAAQIISQIPPAQVSGSSYYSNIYFDKGDGQATATVTGTAAIRLGADIPYTDVTFGVNAAGNPTLTLNDTGESLTVLGTTQLPAIHFMNNGTLVSLSLKLGSASAADTLTSTANAVLFDGKGAPSGSQDYESDSNSSGNMFIFDPGYGHLEIYDNYATQSSPNILQFGPGITASQITVTEDSSNNLYLSDGVTGDRIELYGELGYTFYGVQQVQFADGTSLTQAQLYSLATTGTTGADTIYGSGSPDIFDGKGAPSGSQDYESDSTSGNTFIFNPGYGHLEIYDSYASASSPNILQFGPGITASQITVTEDSNNNLYLTDGVAGDRIELYGELGYTFYGVQRVQFADGTSLTQAQLYSLAMAGTTGANTIYGSGSPDIFDGKGAPSGSEDYEYDSTSGNTFIFNPGYGHLEIRETYGTASSPNILQFGPGITASQITVTEDSNNNLYLTDGVTGDRIELDGELGSTYYGVQRVQFVDGTSLTQAQLYSLAMAGTTGANTIYGSGSPDIFDGKGAPSGSEDYEYDSTSGNTFIFNPGYGHLEIRETYGTATSPNILQFGPGITASQITITKDNNNNLSLTDGMTGDRVELDSQLSSSYYGVQNILFSDGTSLTAAQWVPLSTTGTTAANTISGSPAADVIDGKGAPSGAQDTETGYGGGDTFIFNQGYGHLEISETDYKTNPLNILQFGAGITASQVGATVDTSGNLYLTDGTSGDQIKLDGELNSIHSGVQEVLFSDGSSLIRAQLITLAELISGTTAANSLSGTSSPNIFDGKGVPSGSQDTETGNGGNDTFIFNQGYGHLEISETDYNSSPNNVLQFGPGITESQIIVTEDSSNNIYLTDGVTGDQVKLDSEMSAALLVSSRCYLRMARA